MKSRLIISAALCCLSAFCARAQFYTSGNEAFRVKWSRMDTGHYRIIYPRGLDSLARVYAVTLEQVAEVVGNSAGFAPNASYRRRMPVVLRPYSARSNGMVMWIPRRMELLTRPDPEYPEATPWERQLVIHESRHVSQMQFGAARPFRVWNILTGELAPGAAAAIYLGQAFMEGDAVVAETALSDAGRGRTADFLEYYRVSFADGDMRDFWKWRYGSQKKYTPDYYRAGYVALAGIRAIYDEPDFTAKYFARIARKHGFSFLSPAVKEITGKSFNAAFREVSDSLAARWSADERARSPFIPSARAVSSPKVFTEYNALTAAGDSFFAVRKSLTSPDELVRISPDGTVRRTGLFSSGYTGFKYSEANGTLYWSEYSSHPRWEQVSYSDIRCLDSLGNRRTLTRSRHLFHPAPSDDGRLLSVTEYPVEGGCNVLILDAHSGDVLATHTLPDGLQVIETLWLGEELYASILSPEGYGIWRLNPLQCVLGPQTVKIKRLWQHGGKIMFTSDLSGVCELYSLDPAGGELRRITSTRFGANDFQFDSSRNALYYSALTPEGRLIFSTPADSLICEKADFGIRPRFPFAEELSGGEKRRIDYGAAVETETPGSYSKLLNSVKLHSWAPIYVDYDAVSSLSLSDISFSASPGATLFFQNDLGSAYGFVGYKAELKFNEWRHSGHLNFTYRGFFPVIETRVDFNDRNAAEYDIVRQDNQLKFKGSYTAGPLLSAQIRTYLPLGFSRGGLNMGVIPQIKFGISNDRSIAEGYEGLFSKLTSSLRAYLTENIPSSRVYPRWGVGAEFCLSSRLNLSSLIGNEAYAYLYGYVPGLWPSHGLRLSALYSAAIGDESLFREALANVTPRGFSSSVNNILSSMVSKTKFSADYVMPVFPVDWSFLSPVAYIRNFELTPHADVSILDSGSGKWNLCSFGADFCVRLGNLLWIPYATRIGLSYNYNCGSLYNAVAALDQSVQRHRLGFVFSVEM